jgi:copper(I)-binding protein
LIHGNVCDTNFTSNAATGTGIGLQFSGQGGTVSGTEMRDITVANNFVTRCTRPFYISPYYNQNPSLVPDPSNRIAAINNVFMRSRREERDNDSNEDLLGMTSSSGPAGEVDYGPYTVQHNTWVVPPGQPNSAAFMVLVNSSDVAHQVVSASSPVANTVELHTHTNNNGVMEMRQISQIDVPAQGKAELAPGGLHIMLIELRQELKVGESVAVTLNMSPKTRAFGPRADSTRSMR